MLCKKCQNPISEATPICEHCGCQKNNQYVVNQKYPMGDKFGYAICSLMPNSHKKRLRLRHINKLPEYERERANNKTKGLGLSFWFFLVFCFVLAPIFLVICSEIMSDSTFGWIFVGICIVGYISYKLVIRSTLKNKPRVSNDTYIHETKQAYYYNQYVLGYTILDHMTDGGRERENNCHYVFCEVEKQNIRGVTYDSRYAEYVLLLYKPIYADHRCPKTTEFRIADIFDDIALSEALGCDLPPRNVPY